MVDGDIKDDQLLEQRVGGGFRFPSTVIDDGLMFFCAHILVGQSTYPDGVDAKGRVDIRTLQAIFTDDRY